MSYISWHDLRTLTDPLLSAVTSSGLQERFTEYEVIANAESWILCIFVGNGNSSIWRREQVMPLIRRARINDESDPDLSSY